MSVKPLLRLAKIIQRHAKRLKDDCRAASFTTVGFLMIPMLGAVGLATDTARGYLVKNRLNEALDAAGLAAARESELAAQRAEAEMMFWANYGQSYMDTTVSGPNVAFDEAEDTVTVSATVTLPTTFTRVLGVETMNVASSAVIQRRNSGLELVLVMDNTGSMRGSKMTTMKSAAQTLIDILFDGDAEVPDMWVGLVPYSSMVNIGGTRTSWLESPLVGTNFQPTTWKGCVEARDWPLDTTDDTYQVLGNGFTPALYGNNVDNYWKDEIGILYALMNWYRGYPDSLSLPFVDGTSVQKTMDQVVEEVVRQGLRLGDGDPLPEPTLLASVQRMVLMEDRSIDADDSLPSGPSLTDELTDYLSPHEVDPFPSGERLQELLLYAYLWRNYLYEDNNGDVADPEEDEDDAKNNSDWRPPMVRDANGEQNAGTGPNLGCGPAITPLVASYDTITAAIAEMQPWHRGGTTSNLGLVWGWRVLSPEWRGLWGGDTPADMPLDYDEPLMTKAIVLLTDGNNEVYDEPTQDGPWSSDYTAYGRVGEGRVRDEVDTDGTPHDPTAGNGTPLTSKNAARREVDQRMLSICDAMKADDVEIQIFTITFRQNNGDTQALFRNCASEEDFYYNSPTNAQLEGIFEEIAEKLTELRIAR